MELTNFAILPGTVLPFDVATDLENNFWSGANVTATTWDPNGYVDVSYNGGTVGNTAWIYNTGATGGTGDHPGTASGATLNTYSSVILQADVAFDALSGSETDSFGFYTNINSTATGAFVVLVCPQSSTSFDVRIGGNATPTVSGGSAATPDPDTVSFASGFWLNTSTGTGPITNLSQPLTVGTFYTVQVVETQNITADTIDYQVNLFTTDGALLGSYDTGTISGVASGYNQAGQVGIFTRDKSTTGTTHIQNLIIDP